MVLIPYWVETHSLLGWFQLKIIDHISFHIRRIDLASLNVLDVTPQSSSTKGQGLFSFDFITTTTFQEVFSDLYTNANFISKTGS